MELRFVPPDLQRLDDTPAEVVACAMWTDERPLRGVAGLIDWRLAGRVSKLLRENFVRGDMGEVLCIQGRPRLPYEKVILVGAGERASFDEARFKGALATLLRALSGLHVKRAVVQLPGRDGDRIAPERAAELVLEAAGDSEDHDAWWLIEPADAQARMASRAGDDRRRGPV